jgi:DNA-binding LytR/AlgR family response regulator
MQISCLIVDDEPLSQDILADYVNDSPELHLVAVCNDAMEAGSILKEKKVDLLFLDINMPKLSGIGFVKSLKEQPFVVFVTAYPEYALDGFDLDAVDYLLKPVSFERFRIAVNRVMDRMVMVQSNQKKPENHIMVWSDKKKYRINFDDILMLEAQGDYVRFVLAEKSLMVHGTLKDFFGQLPGQKFVRIHKSYVIAVSKVDYVEGNQVKIDKYKIPVSLSYREHFFKILG